MINTVLDFAIDHAAVFAAALSAVVLSLGSGAIWAYDRYHDRARRRRGAQVIG